MSDEMCPGIPNNPEGSMEDTPANLPACPEPVEKNRSDLASRSLKLDNRRHQRYRGGQPGNQNARKHGFYSKTIPPNFGKNFTTPQILMV